MLQTERRIMIENKSLLGSLYFVRIAELKFKRALVRTLIGRIINGIITYERNVSAVNKLFKIQ